MAPSCVRGPSAVGLPRLQSAPSQASELLPARGPSGADRAHPERALDVGDAEQREGRGDERRNQGLWTEQPEDTDPQREEGEKMERDAGEPLDRFPLGELTDEYQPVKIEGPVEMPVERDICLTADVFGQIASGGVFRDDP